MSETTDPRIDLQAPQLFVLLEDARDLPLVGLATPLGDVTAISVRSVETADATLPTARELGCKRVVQVVDPIFAQVDYLAVAHGLACAVRHLAEARGTAPIVVFTGDRGRGAVGPAVAERLALPHLGAVYGVEKSRDQLLVDRPCGATTQRLRGAPPIVLACVLSGRARIELAPASTDVETLGLPPLRITLPELTYRRRFLPERGVAPEPRARLVPSLDRLAERLARDGVWPRRKTGG